MDLNCTCKTNLQGDLEKSYAADQLQGESQGISLGVLTLGIQQVLNQMDNANEQ